MMIAAIPECDRFAPSFTAIKYKVAERPSRAKFEMSTKNQFDKTPRELPNLMIPITQGPYKSPIPRAPSKDL